MRIKLSIGLTFACFMLFKSTLSYSQDNSFGTICYCTTAGFGSPQSILQMDNNLEILLDARSGAAAEDLNATRSQLKLLTDWRLLSKMGSEYKTNMPVLDSINTMKLRSYSKAYASKINSLIQEDVEDLVDYLAKQNRTNNTYSILFSYILDGLIWDEFEELKLVKGREVTASNPLWSGEFWAIQPERQEQFGTNSLCDGSLCLKINWNRNSVRLMRVFFTNFNMLSALLSDIADDQSIENPQVINTFKEFDFFDKDGTLTIPIINENEDNYIYNMGKQIITKIAESVSTDISLDAILKEFSFATSSQALVILYHEIMWDILDTFDQNGILSKPAAFGDNLGRDKSSAADLLFVTISDNKN